MTDAAKDATIQVDAAITQDADKGGWTYVALPGSKGALGTGKAVRVSGTVDAVEIQATLLPLGGGTHMLPLKASIMRALGKQPGETVAVEVRPAANEPA